MLSEDFVKFIDLIEINEILIKRMILSLQALKICKLMFQIIDFMPWS
jgi:hypothetical protein